MYRAELYKFNKSGSYRFMIVLLVLLTLFIGVFRPYDSIEETLHHLGDISCFFIIFLAARLALLDRAQNTIRNMIASGMRPASIYYAKMRVAITAVLVLTAIESGAALVTAFFYHGINPEIGIGLLAANVVYHFVIAVFSAMLYYAVAVFAGNTSWAILLSVAYYMLARPFLSSLSTAFNLSLDLGTFTLPGISAFTVSGNMAGSQIAAIAATLLLVIVFTVFVQLFTAGRDIN